MISFKEEMLAAILEGYKTQTRRPCSTTAPPDPEDVKQVKGHPDIYLQVVGIRAERLQDISAEDALAEGVQIAPGCSCDTCHTTSNLCPADSNDAVFAFAWVWDTIYWERGLGWETNPWVWVIEFILLDI